jgi:hypothetical protein
VKVSTLRDYKNPTTNLRGWFYRSEKTRIEFDCQGKRVRELFSTFYSGQMGRGIVISNEPSSAPWKAITSEGVDEELTKRACGKQ